MIGYQIIYNLQGAIELGVKYLSLLHLVYSVGALLPALFLGIHATRLSWSTKQEDR